MEVAMKKIFYGSLCYQGIRGGAIAITNHTIRYKNQTLTLPEQYKNITIPIKQIKKIQKGRVLLLPTVTIYLKNPSNQQYKFVVFNRKRFLNVLHQIKTMCIYKI